MTYNPEIHQRRSIRLNGYDYTQPGAYFITICSHQRDEIFGEVVNGEMRLSALGEIVCQEWLRSAGIRKEIKIVEDEFVVMPNHIHGILWIVETASRDARRASPGRASPGRASLQRPPRSLGSFIAGFKASVTSRARRELHMAGIWQRNYYEHIIRNALELQNIWNYMDTNPFAWQDDELHPLARPNIYDQG